MHVTLYKTHSVLKLCLVHVLRKIFLCPPWKREHIVLQVSVGWSVGRLVCRPSFVCSISSDPFTWSIPNLVQGLSSMSKCSLLIFRSHVPRSRSNHSSQPTVLSAQYLLTPSLDQYQTWSRGCLQWVDDPYWFSGHMFKGQGQTTLMSPLCCPGNILWPLHLINTKLGAEVVPNK